MIEFVNNEDVGARKWLSLNLRHYLVIWKKWGKYALFSSTGMPHMYASNLS